VALRSVRGVGRVEGARGLGGGGEQGGCVVRFAGLLALDQPVSCVRVRV